MGFETQPVGCRWEEWFHSYLAASYRLVKRHDAAAAVSVAAAVGRTYRTILINARTGARRMVARVSLTFCLRFFAAPVFLPISFVVP